MLISVIIPTYNEEGYIQKVLKHLLISLKKCMIENEIIIVDSGNDETFNISKSLVEKTYKFTERGVSKARNYGVSKSQGDVLVFMDADVLVSPKNFSEVNGIFKNNRKIVALISKVESYESKNFVQKAFYILANALIDACNISPFFLKFYNYGNFLAVKREVFLKTTFNENMSILEIADLLNRVKKYGKVRVLEHVVYESSRRVKQLGILKLMKIYVKNYLSLHLMNTYDMMYEVIR